MRTMQSALAAIVSAFFILSACSRDPVAASQRSIERGDRYAKEGKYPQAAIEYRRAIQRTPQSVEAHTKLADVAARTSDAATVVRELLQIADLAPTDVAAQVRAGSLFLLGGRYVDARARAEAALRLDREDAGAHLLLGGALAGLHDRERSEASVREAVRLAPQLVEARVALGSYEWSAGRAKEAEAAFHTAVHIDPAHPLANRAVALLYMATDRAAMAEPHWKAVAVSPSGDPFALADYYASQRRLADAERELRALVDRAPLRAAAEARLASVLYSAGDKARAYETLDAVLGREPKNGPALLLKARFQAADHKLNDALASVQAAETADPSSADPAYLEGQIHAAAQDTERAVQAFQRAWKLNPSIAAAAVAIAQLRLQEGHYDDAIEWSERVRRARPDDLAARLIFIRALLRGSQTERAIQEAMTCVADWPRSAVAHVELGTAYATNQEPDAARRAFMAALTLDPASTDALAGLTVLDVRAKRPAQAQARIEARLRQAPNSVPLLLLAAGTSLATGAVARAEASLKRAIEIEPANLEAFQLLGQLYLREQRLDAAREQFSEMARRDGHAVSAGTMVAMILEAQHRRVDAQGAYERILAEQPGAAVAANNLAWMYQQQGRLDEALRLALVAKGQLRRSPQVNDTLGWIYVRQEQPLEAIPLLAACAEARPDNPLYRYHLAVAYWKAGYSAQAQKALTTALASPKPFDGREAALDLLQQLAATPSSEQRGSASRQ